MPGAIPAGTFDSEKYWFNIALHVITGIDITVQLYNAFMGIYVTDKSIKTYRYFMLYSTIADLMYIIALGVLFQPTTLAPSPCHSMHGLLHAFGVVGAEIAFCATSACVALVMASQAHSLLYRMIVLLQRPEIEEMFLSRKGIAFFGCTHVLGAVVLAFFARFALTTEPWPFHEPKYVGFQGPADDVYLCVKFDLFEAKRVVLVSVLLAQGGLWMVIVVGAMLVILAQVRRNKKTMVMSEKTCRMHLYFVRLLLAQLAGPFLCFIVPGTCAAVVIFLKTFTFVPRAPLLALIISEICILLLAIFPLVNGILTLRFVAPYWRFTKDLLRLVRPRPSPSVQGIVNTSSMQSITEAKTPAFPVDFIRGRQMYVRRGLIPKLNGRIGAPRFDGLA